MPRFLLGRRGRFGAAARHYVGDLVYGANDGIITTFAVVAGVAGADLAATTVLILGFANLLADGFSMGASNFLAIRSRIAAHVARARERAQDAELPGAEPAVIELVHDAPGPERPLRHGFATFSAFIIAGTVPLVAYLLPIQPDSRFPAAIAFTLATLFLVGALRNFVTRTGWWRSGFEMLAVGSVAALVAYGVGAFIARIVGVGGVA